MFFGNRQKVNLTDKDHNLQRKGYLYNLSIFYFSLLKSEFFSLGFLFLFLSLWGKKEYDPRANR